MLDDQNLADCLSVVTSDDSSLFDLACAELGNRNARIILKEISNGVRTSGEIASSTRLTVQNVIKHLNRLEKIGIISKDGFSQWSARGRSATRYRISRAAVLLIPEEVSVTSRLMEAIRSRSKEVFNSRLYVSLVASALWFWSALRFILPILTGTEAIPGKAIAAGSSSGTFYGSTTGVQVFMSGPVALVLLIISAGLVFLASFIISKNIRTLIIPRRGSD